MKIQQYAMVIGITLTSFVAVHAQQPASAGKEAASQKTSSVSANDRDFMAQAAAAGHKEIALAQLAEQKGASPSVKGLAERIRKDHMQSDQELKSLAQTKGVTLPPPADHKAEIAKLEKDANFDQTYATMMVGEHKKAIALFERGSTSKDADVRAFADKTLPALREHLKLSQEAASGKAQTAGSPSDSGRGGASGASGTSKPGTTKPADPSAPAPK